MMRADIISQDYPQTPGNIDARIKALIELSPYKQRINYLLDNQRYHSLWLSENTIETANCIGTALYTLNLHESVRDSFPESFQRDDIVFPEFETQRPPYIEPYVLERLLINPPDDLEFSDLVRITTFNDGIPYLEHAGVYLGTIAGSPQMFHQWNTGGQFLAGPIFHYLYEEGLLKKRFRLELTSRKDGKMESLEWDIDASKWDKPESIPGRFFLSPFQ